MQGEQRMKQAHRPRALDDEQTAILENRIELSKVLDFSLTQLSNGFQISIATLHRYKSPEYREASVKYSRENYLSYRKSLSRGVCYRCRDNLIGHSRCKDCEILLHVGSPFGDTQDGISCTGCIDSRNRQIMRAYDELTS